MYIGISGKQSTQTSMDFITEPYVVTDHPYISSCSKYMHLSNPGLQLLAYMDVGMFKCDNVQYRML